MSGATPSGYLDSPQVLILVSQESSAPVINTNREDILPCGGGSAASGEEDVERAKLDHLLKSPRPFVLLEFWIQQPPLTSRRVLIKSATFRV